MKARERYPKEDYRFSDELCAFMDNHPEFEQSLKVVNRRFRIFPVIIISRLPPDGPHPEDDAIGLWYLDLKNQRAGMNPLFKQDFIVDLGRRSEEFVSYSANYNHPPYVRRLSEFFKKYGAGGKFYHNGQRWQHHYNDVGSLPLELQPIARNILGFTGIY